MWGCGTIVDLPYMKSKNLQMKSHRKVEWKIIIIIIIIKNLIGWALWQRHIYLIK